MLRIELEPEALTNRRQQQHYFHHREVVSDTLTWSTAEREVSVFCDLVAVGPSLGSESASLIEVARIAMRHPLKREELRPLRHVIAADLRLFDRLAPNRICRRI